MARVRGGAKSPTVPRWFPMSESPVLDGPESIAAHLSEAIAPFERGRRGVRFVLCDGDNRVLVHCPVDDVPTSYDQADCVHVASVFATALLDGGDDGALLVVVTRPGPDTIGDPDRIWYHAANEVCAKMAIRLIGVYLVTPAGHREIMLDDAL
jgi:hypothetical protein